MNYPLISEYIEAIKAAEDNFDQLKHLRPVIGDDGLPVMTSGNFAVVFKMKDEQTGKLYAVKCFTKEQEGRAEAYKLITEELATVDSLYILSIKYLEKELFVDTMQTNEIEFPVLLMDWVEGKTLDKYLRENLDDKYALEMLAYRFSQLAQWLIPQPFAHGDLKPDNILVKEDGTLVLVDYDGMYVPAMKGQKARELGSPDFRHPSRTEGDFDEHIDDFSLVSILLSLKAISLQPELFEQYGATDRLLFSSNDYRNLSESQVMDAIKAMMQDPELATLYSIFILSAQNNLSQVSFRLLNLIRPKEPEYENLSTEVTDEDIANAWTDEYGVKYSPDRRRLLKAPCEIKEYVISPGTIVICDDAFSYFILPDANHHGFKLSELSSVIIPNSVTCIGRGAFFQCQKLASLFIPNSVTSIGVDAFCGCKELSCIQVEEGNDVYDSRKNCNAIIQTLDNKLILGCSKTTIPNDIVSIGQRAFSLNNELISVSIPDSVTSIDQYAFQGCNGLKVIVLPQNVKFIGKGAFSFCTNVKTVVFPDKVVTVGQQAFLGCKNLHEVYIPKVFPIFEKKAFSGCPNVDFINPDSYVIS